ncbi:hypothetical protein DLAC_02796 [Tieghemostelium lacteum]|uniref:Choline transporter-like protein n=1 Tax=Tieghemostelium lacteum TaxID=361077 RepID=A0A152A3B5_TIELA|nr:hypothetical protein DLAC_02796 [Tieghemostelium lacteum]|eukprot:KYR00753.1 hypothetical protein DLAC_02796 [Tieghemostelium lacteum]
MDKNYNNNNINNGYYQSSYPLNNETYKESTNSNLDNYTFFYPQLELKPVDKGYHKFPRQPKYRDLIWLIVFVMHLLALVALFVISSLKNNGNILSSQENSNADSGQTNLLPQNQYNVYYMLGLAVGVSMLFAFTWLLLIKYFTKPLIYLTLVISILMLLSVAVVNFIYGYYFLAIMSAIFTFITAIAIWSWRNRINFAVLILQTIIPILNEYWGTFIVSFIGLTIQLIWTGFWSYTLIISQDFNKDINYLSFILMLLSYFWTTQVIKNWVHVTIAGSVSTHYFMVDQAPTNPTYYSMKRASSTSLGSICLGSLFVSIIQTLRQLTYLGQDNRGGNILLLCARCILNVLEGILEYFNIYAFVQVAVYGKSYIQSAKDTWELIKSHGIEAVINDSLISGILNCGILIGGVVVGLIIGFISHHFVPVYYIQITIVSVLIAITTIYIMMELIQSSVVTLFVCFVMEPEVLSRNSPDLYQKLTVSYHTW